MHARCHIRNDWGPEGIRMPAGTRPVANCTQRQEQITIA
jgi:hypothetical protein